MGSPITAPMKPLCPSRHECAHHRILFYGAAASPGTFRATRACCKRSLETFVEIRRSHIEEAAGVVISVWISEAVRARL
jgi:hypothetical protein